MKRLAVWLSVMLCFFGSYQLYAAPSKVHPGAIAFLVRYAREHNWPWWVILLIGVFGVGCFIEDRKKKD